MSAAHRRTMKPSIIFEACCLEPGESSMTHSIKNIRQGCKKIYYPCCTKVIMSGVNGNVIMSGCRDDNPDDERREAARDNTKSVSRGADSGGGRDGDRSQRATVLPDQSWGNQARGEGSGAWESGSS